MQKVTLTLELTSELAKQVLDFLDNTSSDSISEPTASKVIENNSLPSEAQKEPEELEIDVELLEASKRPKMPLFGRSKEVVEEIRKTKVAKDIQRESKIKSKKEIEQSAIDEVTKIKEAVTTETTTVDATPPWKL